jgi:hypothetical protein
VRAWAPAIAAHDWVLRPKSWLWIEAALLILGSVWTGSIVGGMVAALFTPIAALGLMLIYGLCALARNWGQALVVGLGLGTFAVVSQGLGEGIGSSEAMVAFFGPVVLVGLFRAVHEYASHIWTAAPPE